MSHLEELKIVSDIQFGFRKSHSWKPNCASPSKILLKTLIMASKAILSCLTLLKLLILSHTNASYSIQAKPLQRTGHNQQVDSSLEGLKIRLCQAKVGRNGNTWEVFPFFERMFLALMPEMGKGRGVAGGRSYARYHGHQKVEITHHSDWNYVFTFNGNFRSKRTVHGWTCS